MVITGFSNISRWKVGSKDKTIENLICNNVAEHEKVVAVIWSELGEKMFFGRPGNYPAVIWSSISGVFVVKSDGIYLANILVELNIVKW